MKKLLKTVNQALDLLEWHEPVKDDRDNETKPGYCSFKLEVIGEGSPLYRVVSDVMSDLNLDDNSRYGFVNDTLETMKELLENGDDPEDYEKISEAADSATPVYTYDLLEWMSKGLHNYGWVEEDIDEYGWQGNLPQAIMMGYSRAWTSVYNEILNALQDYLKK